MAQDPAYPARVRVLGCPVDPYTMAQTVSRTAELVEGGSFAHLIGVNADKVLQMRDDPAMAEIVEGCEIVNADGASMLMAAERLGTEVPERVSGIDLMGELCALAAERGWGVYLLGARSDVVEEAAGRLREAHAGLRVIGARDGYFGSDEYADVAEEIRAASPRITFVGITSPKKEEVIEFFRRAGLKGAFVGVGGSFDVVSGRIPRAPLWMQRARLEWLFRMMQEPGRLLRRYAVGNVRFMRLLRQEARAVRREESR